MASKLCCLMLCLNFFMFLYFGQPFEKTVVSLLFWSGTLLYLLVDKDEKGSE